MKLSLRGLTLAPSQQWGAVRLVPVLRQAVRSDLRLWSRPQRAVVTGVDLGHRTDFYNYVPSALVLDWTEDGSPAATPVSQLLGPTEAPEFIKIEHRMVKRVDEHAVRFFPQQLALDGLLAHHFGGPNVAWAAWSAQAIRRGLSPRSETFARGDTIRGLDEALRHFELHPDQVGVLVFVAERFGAAYLMPSPAEYRPLHPTLLTDAFGELLADFALWHPTVYPWKLPPEGAPRDLADLRTRLVAHRAEWARFQQGLADDLLGEALRWQVAYRAGPFTLARFLPTFAPGKPAHVGEAILDDNGEVQYLRTVLLSEAARERAWWLDQLASVEWSLEQLGRRMQLTEDQVRRRLVRAGWGHLLKGSAG